MTDWADEMADKCWPQAAWEIRQSIAAALRKAREDGNTEGMWQATKSVAEFIYKAKAEGMREAANWCDDQRNIWHPSQRADDCAYAANRFRARADQIEKGEA